MFMIYVIWYTLIQNRSIMTKEFRKRDGKAEEKKGEHDKENEKERLRKWEQVIERFHFSDW